MLFSHPKQSVTGDGLMLPGWSPPGSRPVAQVLGRRPALGLLEPVQAAVLAPRLALGLLEPLHEQHPEAHHSAQVAGPPPQAAGDVLVAHPASRPAATDAGVPVL